MEFFQPRRVQDRRSSNVVPSSSSKLTEQLLSGEDSDDNLKLEANWKFDCGGS